MEEKKDQERSEEMSLEDLKETSRGEKGHCGFKDEAGHCGYTCESDGDLMLDGYGSKIHCPECWGCRVFYYDGPRGWVDSINLIHKKGITISFMCKMCKHEWTGKSH